MQQKTLYLILLPPSPFTQCKVLLFFHTNRPAVDQMCIRDSLRNRINKLMNNLEQEEKFDKIIENSRKQNETMSEKFDKIDENFKKQEENSRKQNETLRYSLKQIEKINEESLRRIEGKMENFNKEIWETFGEKFENVNTLIQKADTYKEETNKQMDHSFNNLDETLDSTLEGIKVSPNTEERRKEIEITEYQGVMPSENKNSHNKKDNQYLEKKTKKIRKTCRKKIINTREEWEMITGGLINVCLLYTSRCV